MQSILATGIACIAFLCTGCASVTQGRTHLLRVETVTDKGELVDGADCKLANDRVSTVLKSGSSIFVRRSSQDLQVTCSKAGLPDAQARLVSRANIGLAGNVIAGGVIGAVVDHNTGAAYTYPTWVRLLFGQHAVFDRRDEVEGTPMLPAGVASPLAAAQAGPTVFAAAPRELPPPPAAAPAGSPPQPLPLLRSEVAAGDTFDYRVTDRQTGRQQTIVLRAERVERGEVSFNGGARVEAASGAVRIASALVGELDNVTPPEGWMPGGQVPRGAWKMRHRSIVPGTGMAYDLRAMVEGEQAMIVDGREVRAVRVDLQGWIESRGGLVPTRARYRAVAWVSPELRRVVRFEARSRSAGNSGGSGFAIDELTELVRVARN